MAVPRVVQFLINIKDLICPTLHLPILEIIADYWRLSNLIDEQFANIRPA
jgi:hypothetical protein